MYIYYWLFLIIFIISLLLTIRNSISEFKANKTKVDKLIFIVLRIVMLQVITVVLVGTILLPFNFYNIKYSKKKPSSTIRCEIIGSSRSFGRRESIYYKYHGATYTIHGSTEIMSEIYINRRFGNYLFVAKIKKGLLDTYVINDWDIIRK